MSCCGRRIFAGPADASRRAAAAVAPHDHLSTAISQAHYLIERYVPEPWQQVCLRAALDHAVETAYDQGNIDAGR